MSLQNSTAKADAHAKEQVAYQTCPISLMEFTTADVKCFAGIVNKRTTYALKKKQTLEAHTIATDPGQWLAGTG